MPTARLVVRTPRDLLPDGAIPHGRPLSGVWAGPGGRCQEATRSTVMSIQTHSHTTEVADPRTTPAQAIAVPVS